MEKKGHVQKGHIDLNGLKTDMKEALRAALVTTLVEEHGYSAEEAEAAVVLGAYLDDVVVGLPAAVAARVPPLAAAAFNWCAGSGQAHKLASPHVLMYSYLCVLNVLRCLVPPCTHVFVYSCTPCRGIART